MSPSTRIVVIAALLLPLAAAAAGLGRITVRSMLGEPLNAEIQVEALQPAEQATLAANIAGLDIYRAAQLTPIPSPDVLRAAVERRPDGGYLVRISSTEPIDQPLVNLLVGLSSSGGSVLRQYTFLVDAVDRKAQAQTPPPQPVERAAAPTAPAPAAAPPAAPTPPAPPVPPAAPAPAATAAPPPPAPAAPPAPTTHVVQRGDTLNSIAAATRHEGVSAAQMAVAIYRANEDAFAGGSVDRLKAGYKLTLPGRDRASAVSADEVKQFAAAQREARARAAATASQGDDRVALDRALAESQDRAKTLEETAAALRKLIEAREREIAELQRQQPGKAAPPARK